MRTFNLHPQDVQAHRISCDIAAIASMSCNPELLIALIIYEAQRELAALNRDAERYCRVLQRATSGPSGRSGHESRSRWKLYE